MVRCTILLFGKFVSNRFFYREIVFLYCRGVHPTYFRKCVPKWLGLQKPVISDISEILSSGFSKRSRASWNNTTSYLHCGFGGSNQIWFNSFALCWLCILSWRCCGCSQWFIKMNGGIRSTYDYIRIWCVRSTNPLDIYYFSNATIPYAAMFV